MTRTLTSRSSLMPQDFAKVSEKTCSRVLDRGVKNASADARFLMTSILCAALLTSSLVFLVWTKMAQMQTGYRVHALQSELLNLRQERSSLRVEVAALKRHDRLHQIAGQLLGLHAPHPEEVMRVSLEKVTSKKTSSTTAPSHLTTQKKIGGAL
ncbi:MAG: hypothetical protein GY822_24145 [Deltaproteobacteria bacterium]|nr:hypothetical protein [Deltaproteobacteria bacterium]